MFEVVLTYRPDFSEKVVERYTNQEEALAAAERIAAKHFENVIRALVRQVREVKTES